MATDQLSATFAALADPTRRAILARLADGEATVPLQAAMSALEALGARPALARARALLSGMPAGAAA